MSRLDLEQQRKRAKDLLRAYRRGDRDAIERVQLEAPHLVPPLQLADAQLVVAREAGFASWPRLKKYAERAGGEPRPALHLAVDAHDLAAVQAELAAGPPIWQTREAIEQAILHDDRDIVRALLAHGGWVDHAGRSDGRWGGVIHTALLLGRDAALIELLLAGGASPAARDRDGRTPLAIAVRTAHAGAADVLRRAGASDGEVDDVDRALGAAIGGGTPRPVQPLRRSDHQHLAWALRSGHAAAVPALLALGLDPNIPDDDGTPALHLAVRARAGDALAALLAAGAQVDARDYRGESALALAGRIGAPALADQLVRAGATRDAPGDLAELFEDAADAIAAGHIDRLRALLDREPRLVRARSLREHRATLLHYCGANGVEDERQKTPPEAPAIAALLLARGAEPDALALTYGGGPAQTTLYLAATSSHPQDAGLMAPLLEALLAGGAHVNDDDRDALRTSQPSALPTLVAAGATVDLWLAARLGRLADVQRLVRPDGSLAPGAKVGSDATTPDAVIRDRALLAAADAGHREIVELLLAAGAHVDATDIVGFTPLHHAAWNDHLAIAQLLLAHGASLAHRNAYDATALGTLRYAIEHDRRPRPNAEALIALLAAAG